MNAILRGAIAGAAGTIALDVTTYADMALRGRASSNLPAEVVRRLAQRLGFDQLARPDEASNDATKARRSALGALSGYAVGVGIGAAYGLLQPYLRRVPFTVRAVGLAAAAMAAADVPAARLGATDPAAWDASAWASDAVPHAIYGLVTAGVARSMSEN